jgi:hypothetical protein
VRNFTDEELLRMDGELSAAAPYLAATIVVRMRKLIEDALAARVESEGRRASVASLTELVRKLEAERDAFKMKYAELMHLEAH